MPSSTDRKVEPKPTTIELTKRCPNLDGPAITMLRERTSRSYQVSAGGSEAMYSGDWRERVVKTLT